MLGRRWKFIISSCLKSQTFLIDDGNFFFTFLRFIEIGPKVTSNLRLCTYRFLWWVGGGRGVCIFLLKSLSACSFFYKEQFWNLLPCTVTRTVFFLFLFIFSLRIVKEIVWWTYNLRSKIGAFFSLSHFFFFLLRFCTCYLSCLLCSATVVTFPSI